VNHPSFTALIPEPIRINIDSIKLAEIKQRQTTPKDVSRPSEVEETKKKKKKFLNFLFKKN
jgi:hypothetical protein